MTCCCLQLWLDYFPPAAADMPCCTDTDSSVWCMLFSWVQYEPGEDYNTGAGNSVTARYNLTVSNLVPGSNYTTYRFPGRLPPGRGLLRDHQGSFSMLVRWQYVECKMPVLAWLVSLLTCGLARRFTVSAGFRRPPDCAAACRVSLVMMVAGCSQPWCERQKTVHALKPRACPQHGCKAQGHLRCTIWLHIHSLHSAREWTGHTN